MFQQTHKDNYRIPGHSINIILGIGPVSVFGPPFPINATAAGMYQNNV